MMNNSRLRKRIGVILVLCLVTTTVLTGCGKDEINTGSSASKENTGVDTTKSAYSGLTTPGVNVELVGDYSEKAIKAEWDEATSTKITFVENQIAVDGAGASVTAGLVTIAEGGTYVLSGTGADVQVVVEVDEEDDVQLVLNDVTLENSSTAPINIVNGKNAYITLADGTKNTIRDTREAYVEPEEGEEVAADDGEDPIEAAVYSEIDLVLNGTGELVVEAGYDDGVRTKDDMDIISGTYHVTSQDDAFVGKDSISVRDGNITTVAKGAALKSNKSDDLEKGYVVIDGGTFDLTATEGDGLHGEYALVINGGDILIRESEEGLEAMNIVVNGGNIELFATDDGVNISEAEEYADLFGSEERKQMPEDTAVDHIEGALIINGGNLHVTAQGDGLDSNGDILITGGTTIVCGPTNSGNGTLDYADTFDMTGGVLAISGNQGMEQSISSDTIPVVTMHFSGRQAADTEVTIADESGKELFAFMAKQEFSYVAFASRDLTVDNTYQALAGKVTAEGTAALGQPMGMGGMMPGSQRPEGQMPGGQRPDGQMHDGEVPARPEGQMPGGEVPQMPDGEVPQKPDGTL